MDEENGWDFGPGNMDDFGPSAGDYTVPTESNFDSYYDLGSGPNPDRTVYDTAGDFGPGNSEQWTRFGDTSVFGDGQFGGGFLQGGQFQQFNELPGFQSPIQQNMGSVQNTLANIFNNKGFVTGLGALAEGYQNKKKAAALQQMVSQNRQALDPFGSQRPFYQQQLQQAVQDPYSAPIVSAQVEQLKRAQDIKNAAAGRRSNSATTDPALMAAMAGVAQNYMNSLQTPAGANISPQGLSSLMAAQQQGINNDVNGYLSPTLSAMGRSAGVDQNTKTLEALRELLTGGR